MQLIYAYNFHELKFKFNEPIRNLNLTLLQKLNTLKSLSQNVVFNLIQCCVCPQLFGRSARSLSLFIKIAMEETIDVADLPM